MMVGEEVVHYFNLFNALRKGEGEKRPLICNGYLASSPHLLGALPAAAGRVSS